MTAMQRNNAHPGAAPSASDIFRMEECPVESLGIAAQGCCLFSAGEEGRSCGESCW